MYNPGCSRTAAGRLSHLSGLRNFHIKTKPSTNQFWTYLNAHASSPQTPLSQFILSTGICTNCPFRIFTPHLTEPSRIFTASLVGISSSRIATRIEECTGGMTRRLSRMTLFKKGRASSSDHRDCQASLFSVEGKEGNRKNNERSSVRRRSCVTGLSARRRSVQVRAREVVSEPAKKNVLTLCRRSSSEMRCSGEISVDRLDLTGKRQHYLRFEGEPQLTEKTEEVDSLIAGAIFFSFNDSLCLLLYNLPSDTVDDFL